MGWVRTRSVKNHAKTQCFVWTIGTIVSPPGDTFQLCSRTPKRTPLFARVGPPPTGRRLTRRVRGSVDSIQGWQGLQVLPWFQKKGTPVFGELPGRSREWRHEAPHGAWCSSAGVSHPQLLQDACCSVLVAHKVQFFKSLFRPRMAPDLVSLMTEVPRRPPKKTPNPSVRKSGRPRPGSTRKGVRWFKNRRG